MLNVYEWSQQNKEQRDKLLSRPTYQSDLQEKVRQILLDIQKEGVEAVLRYTEKFDQVKLRPHEIVKHNILGSLSSLPSSLHKALLQAQSQIESFHQAQYPNKFIKVETGLGIVCEQVYKPIERVGIYVPGGRAPLFSTLLMLAIPARLAGCSEIVVVSPPQSNGRLHPTVLACCELVGVKEVWAVGGVQAIGLLGFGDEVSGFKPVNKIFGPGNSWVTEAKRQITQFCPQVGTDLPAGPSEVLVIADKDAQASFVAWDLLSQAEHGPDSQVILISSSKEKVVAVRELLNKEVQRMEESRKKVIEQSLSQSRAFICRDIDEALEISNKYAPEHLILQVQQPRFYQEKIKNAGSVFFGPWSPEAVGDYASGTNHVLPTAGAAHFTGGVNLSSFLKSMTLQELSKEGLQNIAQTVETMAQNEGLPCHAQAVAIRRQWLEEQSGAGAFVKQLVRPNIASIKAYSSARKENKEKNENNEIKLDANELPWAEYSRYPHPQPEQLRERLAELYNVPKDNLLMTRGSDEAVDLLVRTFCEPSRSAVLIHPPTFEIYAHSAHVQGVQVIEVPLDEKFDLNEEKMIGTWKSNPQIRMIFLCSPNNPTGKCLSLSRVETILKEVGTSALVVIDEAYIEFSSYPSWTEKIKDYPQLVVLRTLSKYWGGAGLRFGVAIGHPEVLSQMKKVLAPYPFADPVISLVLKQLQKSPPHRQDLENIKNRVKRTLERMAWVEKVWPSDAHFFLVTCTDAEWAFQNFLSRGIRVRDRSQLWPRSLRISMGNEMECQRLLEVLEQMQGEWSRGSIKGSI